MHPKQFSLTLITWQRNHGRHHLPWQVAEPYARWISEIMLQQTQVATVIEYYDRFMKRFPTVQDLAKAQEDEVMQYWSGLGYYSRARNLHKAAQIIVDEKKGIFPKTRQEWEALPGVGRSTAAAIAAFSFGARETILDGNVKRVLARLFRIESPVNETGTVKELWSLAEKLLPEQNIEDYIQGLMDLGATICSRNPKCILCPFKERCKAFSLGLQNDRSRDCFLQKRSVKGVWEGLYCLPEKDGVLTQEAAERIVSEQGFCVKNTRALESFSHDFSHYRLILHPIAVRVNKKHLTSNSERWIKLADLPDIGLPAPIRSLLEKFFL